jgi:glucose-1-phosphate thymidylyltransferase
MQIACLEEIAYLNGFIDLPALERRALDFDKTSYGRYLAQIAEEYRQARKP